MRAAWVSASLVAIATAGCVAGPDSGPTSPKLPFDGIYQGQVTPTTGGPPACAGDEYGTIQVGDGTLVFPYRSNVIFISVIAKDGAIRAEDNATMLQGTLADDRLELTVSNAGCKTHYAMRRLLGL